VIRDYTIQREDLTKHIILHPREAFSYYAGLFRLKYLPHLPIIENFKATDY